MLEPMLETREPVSASQGRGWECSARKNLRVLREEKPGSAPQGGIREYLTRRKAENKEEKLNVM